MIDRITMAITNMEEMVQFYQNVLPLKLYPEVRGDYTIYLGKVGDVEIIFCPKEIAGVNAAINTIQVRFVVPNVGKAFKNGLAGEGLEISNPQEIGGDIHAALRDPDGNSLELIERN